MSARDDIGASASGPLATPDPDRQRHTRGDTFAIFSATLAVVAVVFAIGATWAAVNAQDHAEEANARADRAAIAATRAPRQVSVTALAPADAVPTVNVTEREFHITADRAATPHGKVKFVSTDTGNVMHELVVMRTDNRPNALPIESATGKVVEDGQGDKDLGEVENIAPGRTKSNTLTLPAGRYVLLCNIPGHYLAGMWTTLVLT